MGQVVSEDWAVLAKNLLPFQFAVWEHMKAHFMLLAENVLPLAPSGTAELSELHTDRLTLEGKIQWLLMKKMTCPWHDALPLDLDTVPFGHRTVASSHYYSVGHCDTKLDVCPMYKFKIHSEIADVHLRVAKAGLSGTYESRGPGVHALEGSPCFLGVKSCKFSSCNLLKCPNFCLDVHKKNTTWLK